MSDEVSFDWDAEKDALNRAKHGLSFVKAQHVFFDPDRINPSDSPGFAVLTREANEGGLKPGV